VALFDVWQLWRIPTQVLEDTVDFGIALGLTSAAVLALGWVEDLAARRKPRVSPFVKRARKPQGHPARGVAQVVPAYAVPE
jgi:hypothetical protein